MTNRQNINPFTLQNRLRISSLNSSRTNNSLSINPFKISDQFYYKMQAMQYQNQQKPFYQQTESPVQLPNQQTPQRLTSETPVQARLAPQQYYKPENQTKIQPFKEINMSKLHSIAIDNTFDSNLKNFLQDIPSQTPSHTPSRIPFQTEQDKLNKSICQDQSFPTPMYRENLVKEQPPLQKLAQIHKIIDIPPRINTADHKLSHRKRIFDNYPKVQLSKRIKMEQLDDQISDLIRRYDIQALYQGHNYPPKKSQYSPTKSNRNDKNQEEINYVFCTLCEEFINDKQLNLHSRDCTIKQQTQIVDPQDKLKRINEKLKKIGQLMELKYQSRRDDNDKQIYIRKLAYISIVIFRQFSKEHAKQHQLIEDLYQVLKLVELLHDDDNVGELIQQAIEFGQIILSYK